MPDRLCEFRRSSDVHAGRFAHDKMAGEFQTAIAVVASLQPVAQCKDGQMNHIFFWYMYGSEHGCYPGGFFNIINGDNRRGKHMLFFAPIVLFHGIQKTDRCCVIGTENSSRRLGEAG